MPSTHTETIDRLLHRALALREGMDSYRMQHAAHVDRVADGLRDSAANMLHYLALRQHDLRDLQTDLAELGLSSLGRCESHVAHNLDRVCELLHLLAGRQPPVSPASVGRLGVASGRALLEAHTERILGPPPLGRSVRIMVTAPSEAAGDPELVRKLAAAGMDCLRINAAHDGPEEWQAMARHVAAARETVEHEVRIQLDLPGPKLRTGPMPKGARVAPGDRLWLEGTWREGRTPKPKTGRPGRVSCSIPEILSRLDTGDPVSFDDGRFETRVCEAGAERVLLEVTRARKEGEKLKSDKGINLPDLALGLTAFGPEDRSILDAMVDEIDAVALSFVDDPGDVRALQTALREHGREDVGLLLKIEHSRAFSSLPGLLLAGMEIGGAGVMVARGDLAVEVGFERLAEVQEEMLWLCESAHMPVVWATEVLENLAKKGAAARAEITDAAESVRAECVMLNKGPNIVDTVRTLDDILRRMADHQHKKTPLMRQLQAWRDWPDRC